MNLPPEKIRAELGSALLRVAEAQDAGSLAAVVLAADSGVPGDALEQARLDQALAALRAAGTPVHVLDLANREPAADAMLAGLRLPARILVGDRVEAGIELRHRGLGGRRATLTIEDDGLILDRHELVLPADRERWLVRRPLGFDQVGSRRVSARIQVEGGDALASNDERGRGVNVVKGPIRVLHFEAEPRFEVKFARRAVEADPALALVSLVRTAENKYYRLGISQPSELAAGFPRDPAELFAYQVLVLGSVAADLLDPAQQATVADFVARRGGGLLLLGGRNSFAEGGYAGTPLAELMPVVLGRQATAFRAEVGLRPGPAARLARLLDFGPEESLDSRLQRLPPLTVVNPLRRAKPGARVLLSAVDTLGEPLVILADQPYGRGRVMSLAVRDTWRWQMHAAMPLEDQTHERLWRQMLRDLGREAGARVQIESMPFIATPGARVTLRARAFSADYRPLAAAPMHLQLTRPTGELLELPMIPDPGTAGTYQAAFQVPTSGLYELRAELREPGEPVVAAGRQLSVSGSGEEFIADPQARQGLARIAEATGGRVLEPDQARVLGGLIDAARTRQPQMRQLAVWDAPVLLFALIALACLEWALRRRWRLP